MTALFTVLVIAQAGLAVGACGSVLWSRGRGNLWRTLLAISFGCGSLAGGALHNPWTTVLNALQCGYWTYSAITHRRAGRDR
ncbi:MAG: hypothetical protein IPJ61_19865 [Tessaracoccus sp.]|jgi:hypothetical protein|uniref:hypothetical protein n=1 Tax=Tessaracoccus sp. TaxID=1971211 RepID=UPI001EB1A154|nr:hypothetical protein [Tessaracoccus sp.]MBK7823244.1 hypothetical protein [Tessaracoccus sp.]